MHFTLISALTVSKFAAPVAGNFMQVLSICWEHECCLHWCWADHCCWCCSLGNYATGGAGKPYCKPHFISLFKV